MAQYPSALTRSASLGLCLLIGCTSRTVLHGFPDGDDDGGGDARELGGPCAEQGDCREGLACDGGTCQVPAHVIYRSAGPGSTAPLASGADNTMSLEGNVATFASPLPNRIGVGDAVVYSTDSTPGVDQVAFIARRVSSTVFALQAADGSAPIATSEPDTQWSILRAYAGLYDALVGSENPGLPTGLGDFDAAGQDLVATGQIWNIACYADAVDSNSSFLELGDSPWTTGPSTYLRVFAPAAAWEVGSSQRHAGGFDLSRYVLVANEVGNPALFIWGEAVRVEGLQIDYDVTSGGQGAIFVQSGGGADIRISSTIVRGRVANPVGTGILIQGTTAYTTRLWNNVIYGFDRHCTVDNTLAGTDMRVLVYSNTLSCGAGLRVEQATLVAKNNIFAGITDLCVEELGGDTFGSDYNVCNLDETLVGANSVSEASAVFVDAAAGDFHLSPADTVAADRGADLSADPFLAFTTDLDGELREGSWDIGADER